MYDKVYRICCHGHLDSNVHFWCYFVGSYVEVFNQLLIVSKWLCVVLILLEWNILWLPLIDPVNNLAVNTISTSRCVIHVQKQIDQLEYSRNMWDLRMDCLYITYFYQLNVYLCDSVCSLARCVKFYKKKKTCLKSFSWSARCVTERLIHYFVELIR